MIRKIGIIGSGSWGTSLAVMLSKKGYDISIWSRQKEKSERLSRTRENMEFLPGVVIPSNVSCTWKLEECIRNTDIVVSAVPSHAVRETARKIKQYMHHEQIILNVSKGLEENSLLRLSQVIESEIPEARIAVMSGPSHAEEVARDLPTTNVVAAKERYVAEFVQDAFMNPKFRVYTNPDMIGVELGGALKNVIALCAGISDGLGFGDNTKAALMTRGIVEIARLGVAMGARIETFGGISGIGDLIVTCTSMHSRNRRAGILIGQGKALADALDEVHMVVEGVKTASAAYQLAKNNNIEMPIVNQAYRVLFENKDAKIAVADLMMRAKTHEMEEIVLEQYNW